MVMAVRDEFKGRCILDLDVGLDAEIATREHVLLVEAIERRDSAHARQLQSEQLARAGERMIAAMRVQSLEGEK